MLRIDEVIDIQKEILKEIKNHNENLNNTDNINECISVGFFILVKIYNIISFFF